MMEVAKRSRKLNWSVSETEVLRNSYLEFRSTIDGRLGMSLTNSQKEQAWRSIQERINAQGVEKRSLDEVKKKLSDMKTSVKKRERERRQQVNKTGGGPAPTVNQWDEKMIEAIGEVAVGGFCGVDTFADTSTESMETAATKLEETSGANAPSCSNAPHTCTGRQNDEKIKEKKNNTVDDTEKVVNLLEEQTATLKSILEEQKRQTKSLVSCLLLMWNLKEILCSNFMSENLNNCYTVPMYIKK